MKSFSKVSVSPFKSSPTTTLEFSKASVFIVRVFPALILPPLFNSVSVIILILSLASILAPWLLRSILKIFRFKSFPDHTKPLFINLVASISTFLFPIIEPSFNRIPKSLIFKYSGVTILLTEILLLLSIDIFLLPVTSPNFDVSTPFNTKFISVPVSLDLEPFFICSVVIFKASPAPTCEPSTALIDLTSKSILPEARIFLLCTKFDPLESTFKFPTMDISPLSNLISPPFLELTI